MKRFLLAAGIAAGIALAPMAAAQANGSDAVVGAVVSDGAVHVQSTKGLSRVTIVGCDDVEIFDSWEGEQLSADLDFSDTVEAVFIHSGDNTTPEAQALLALLAGDDAVKGDSTGATAYYNADACQPEVTTTTTTTAPPTTTTTLPAPEPTTTTTAPPVMTTTTAPPVTTTEGPHWIDCPDGTVVGLGSTCPAATQVEGTTLTQPAADLPFTGSNTMRLAVIGVGLGLFGLLLLLLSTVRRRLTNTDQG